jgi:hypothetical protein
MSDEMHPEVEETGEIQGDPEPGGLVCPNCKAEYRAGFTTCSDCKVDLVSGLPAPAPEPKEVKPSPPNGLKCLQHPGVDAVAKCSACSSDICSTCDFQVAKLHFCPRCIENAPDEKISPRRKRLVVGAIALAMYCTLGGIFTFSGMLHSAIGNDNAGVLGLLIMYGLYVPSFIGTALAFSAFERRLKNTQMIWTALIWNVTVTAVLVLLEISARIAN